LTDSDSFCNTSTISAVNLQIRSPKNRDFAAAQLLIELREQAGLSREQVPHAMVMAGIRRDRIPSAKTIWRVEEQGAIPNIGARAALAEFFDRPLHSIWPPAKPRWQDR
jgi:hypothetical protein